MPGSGPGGSWSSLLGLAFLWGRPGVTLLFAICSFNALREFITLTNARRADHWMLAAVFFVVLPLQYVLVYTDWYGFYTVLIPVYVFLLMPVVSALRGEAGNFLIRVAEVQWAAMVTIYFVSHVPALLSLNIPGFEGQNIQLVAFLIIVVQASDVLQYVWGKLIGKTKIAPSLSPSKDRRRLCRRGCQRHAAGRVPVVGHAVHLLAGGGDGAAYRADGLLSAGWSCRRSNATAGSRTGAMSSPGMAASWTGSIPLFSPRRSSST